MQIQRQTIDYFHADLRMTGYLADGSDASGKAPGVLLAHEAPGLSVLMHQRADALAELGYVAFALDLHGSIGFNQAESRRRHAELMETPFLIRDRAIAALDVLVSQSRVDPGRIGAVGFCQGGITVMELARARASIRCAIGFHPGLKRPNATPEGPIDARVMMMVGSEDPLAPADDRAAFAAEMAAAGAAWEMHLFGGVQHAFTNVGIERLGLAGFHYDARATRRSWAMMLDMLDEVLACGPILQPEHSLP
ncbi:dienelactone hydrolase family protein [Paraburkholderia sp. RL17-347-BIC-D]|uniref:dienelactone hydrolase family protein n=1 Tax=Paraburkholderia sp. RL17-347-BIC-D TaxID=3031632 RepID=UPI0038BAD514